MAAIADIKRIKCLFCDSTFRDNFNLRRHINSKHPEEAKEILKINCSICGLIYIRRKDLQPAVEMCEDCKKRTDIAPPETHTFVDEEEFKKWKQNVELDTSTRYIKSRKTYNLQNGAVRAEFPCYRTTFLSPKAKRLKVKILGGSPVTKKTSTCPAKMICEFQPQGSVTVSFFTTHKGHSLDANKMLSKEKKKPPPPERKKIEMPLVASGGDSSLDLFSDFSNTQPDILLPDDYYKTCSEEYLNNEYNSDIDMVLSQIENEEQIPNNNKKWLSTFCSAVQNLATNKTSTFNFKPSSKSSSKKVLRDNNVPEQMMTATTTNYEAHTSNKMTEEERQSIIQMVLDDL